MIFYQNLKISSNFNLLVAKECLIMSQHELLPNLRHSIFNVNAQKKTKDIILLGLRIASVNLEENT